jgi:queuine tRNA-ribosyltransferase
MDLTTRWAERALAQHSRADQALFGIVQGGIDPDLRAESARATAALGFSGFGIGGLSVGEAASDRNIALEAALAELPAGKPRYVMGLGDPSGVLEAVARGADLFDCVWPTRLARHGRVLTPEGDFNLRRAEFASDSRPLQLDCPCFTCRHHHRGYLRHLLASNELSAFRLLSIHNLEYTLGLLRETRRAIVAGEFDAMAKRITLSRNG